MKIKKIGVKNKRVLRKNNKAVKKDLLCVKVDKMKKKIDQIDGSINVILEEIFRSSERIEKLEENIFSKEDQERLFNILDRISGKVDRFEQEAVFGTQWLKRLQSDFEKQEKIVEKNQLDIQKIKTEIK